MFFKYSNVETFPPPPTNASSPLSPSQMFSNIRKLTPFTTPTTKSPPLSASQLFKCSNLSSTWTSKQAQLTQHTQWPERTHGQRRGRHNQARQSQPTPTRTAHTGAEEREA
eukprot:jgi/Botrbrau1/20556/Bobra.145_2s0103.1